MKKIIKLLVLMLLVFSAAPLSANAVKEKSTQTNQQVAKGEFSATDFVVFTNDVKSLTEKKVIELANVKTPEGVEVSVDKEQFDALKDAKDGQEKKIAFSVEDQVISVTAKIMDSNMLIAPASEVTNGGVTIDIPDYDPATGMIVGKVYSVKVKIDFDKDVTSSGKKVKIHLPEGLRYNTIPVNGTPQPNTPQVNALTPFYDFIESFVAPSKQVYQTFNGDLLYNLYPTTGGVEIDFTVAVDQNLYYGPKVFSQNDNEGIVVSAEKAGLSVGESKMDINATGDVTFAAYSGNWKDLIALENSEVEINTPNSEAYRNAPNLGLQLNHVYAVNAKHTYFFPKEVNYLKSNNDGNVKEVNRDEGYVLFESNNIFKVGMDVRSSLYFNTQGVSKGEYYAANSNKHEITFYDGTVKHVLSSFKLAVKVEDSSAIKQKLQVTARSPEFFDVAPNYTTSVTGVVANDNLTEKKGRYIEYEIEDNFLVDEVVLPVDKATTTSIEYKTNKNSTLQSATGTRIIAANSTVTSKITKSSLNLASDEFITYARVKMPDIATGWSSGSGATVYHTDYRNMQVRGRLVDGIQQANVLLKTYALDGNNQIDEETLSSANAIVSRVVRPHISALPVSGGFGINAGETVKGLKFRLGASTYFYGHTLAMNEPRLYIRLPQGVIINPNSVKIIGSSIQPIVSNPYTTKSGERFIEIRIPQAQGANGSFVDGVSKNLEITLDYSTTLDAGGNFNWNEYAFWMNSVDSTYANKIEDEMDINNNDNTTEYILPSDSTGFSITKNENLIIDTFITPEGEERRAPFDGTLGTAIGFTPGTKAKYTLDILNNKPSAVDLIEAYVPIPKEGLDFGASFQGTAEESKPFKWNMKLGVNPTIKVLDEQGNDITATSGANYIIEYTSEASDKDNWDSATYTNTPSDSTTMIRVTNDSGIVAKERAIIEFEYVVDETAETVEQNPSKLSAINEFNPTYDFKAGASYGRLFGTKVGAQLVVGEVKGLMFEDVDFDGIYTSGTDLPLNNRDVKLYNSSNVLVDTVQTSATGTYSFEGLQNGAYRVDFNEGKMAGEVFTFAGRGADFSLSSHVDNVGPNKGLALEVDPTIERSKNVNAGVFDYNPATDLKVTASEESVTMPAKNEQTSFSTQVNRSFDPKFFSSIRATTNGEVWTSADTNIATVEGGLIKGVNPGPTTVRVTITDIFGNTAEDTVNVNVTSNELPVITAPDQEPERGSTFDPLATVTASDTEDGDLTNKVTLVSSDVDTDIVKDGYSVTVKVEDSQNNVVEKTYSVNVVDTTPPVITADDTHTYERFKTVSQDEFLLDISASIDELGTLTSDFETVVDLSVVYDRYKVTLTATDEFGNASTKEVIVKVEDTTAPVITADDTHTYERFETVSQDEFLLDIGASINELGTLTSDFETVVNLSVVYDSYKVTLTATDEFDNKSTKEVIVKVEDTTAPDLSATPFWIYERLDIISPEEFLQDVDAKMDEEGTITSDFATVVNLGRNGVYIVKVTGTDLYKNKSFVNVAVTVSDKTPGTISALNNIRYERLATVSPEEFLKNVNATMNEPGTITSNFDEVVDLTVADDYEVTLTGLDESLNKSTRLVMVRVSDGTEPRFTYNGEEVNFEYNVVKNYERLLSVTNEMFLADIPVGLNEEGTITTNFEEVVNLDVAGEYQVRLTGKDLSNNETSIIVSVVVIDTVDPVLTADASITYERVNTVSTSSLNEQFLTKVNASMNEDGTLTSNFSEQVKKDVAGEYIVTITATDLSGNTSTKDVTVTIEDTVKPKVTAKKYIKYPFGKKVTPEQFLKDVNASMDEPGKITSNYKDVVKNNKAGKYTVTITATDPSGNVTTLEVIVEILAVGSKDIDNDLPDAGNNSNVIVISGLLLIASSTLLVLNRRKREQ